jgi:hypothetical protein
VTDSEPTLDYVDYTSLSFPSDNLTVAKLRNLYPHRFDVEGFAVNEFFAANEGRNTGDRTEGWVSSMLTAERYLARHAFEDALGKTWTCLTELGDTRDQSAKELAEMYIFFGLATGPQHADQLIRGFEAKAAAQAKSPHAKGPKLGR